MKSDEYIRLVKDIMISITCFIFILFLYSEKDANYGFVFVGILGVVSYICIALLVYYKEIGVLLQKSQQT